MDARADAVRERRDGPTAERAEVRGVMRGVHRHVPPVPRPRVVHREHKVHHRSHRRVVARGRARAFVVAERLRQDTGAVPERVIDRGHVIQDGAKLRLDRRVDHA